MAARAGRSAGGVALLGPGWGSRPKVGGSGPDSGESGGGALPEGCGLRKRAEATHARTYTHAAAVVQSPMPAFPACSPPCPLPSGVPGREGEQSRVRQVGPSSGETGLTDLPNPAPAPDHTRHIGKFSHSCDWAWGSRLPPAPLIWRRSPGSVVPRFPGWSQAHSTSPTLFVT